jgi:hypothetical protein
VLGLPIVYDSGDFKILGERQEFGASLIEPIWFQGDICSSSQLGKQKVGSTPTKVHLAQKIPKTSEDSLAYSWSYPLYGGQYVENTGADGVELPVLPSTQGNSICYG